MKKMQNESPIDRIIRVVVGLSLGLVSVIFLSGTIQLVGSIAAFILIVTGVTGFCAIYKLFGISTLGR